MTKIAPLPLAVALAFASLPTSSRSLVVTPTFHARTPHPSPLSMGILDSISSFLQDREGDFVKLQDSGTAVGPGPLLLLFNLPPTIQIENDEFLDMVEDGAPQAFQQGVIISQISSDNDEILDMPLSLALQKIVDDKGVVETGARRSFETDKSVLYFSGFSNEEMMATYNIVGKEIYEESGGSMTPPACAKAVVNAMEKPLRQVLDEISGDHEHAMSLE